MVELEQAYRRTTYQAFIPDGLVCIRIGQPETQELSRLLLHSDAKQWAFVSACNPGSSQCGASQNQLAHQQLEAELCQRGYRFYPGLGVGDDGRWPAEPSFLVLEIDKVQATQLGRMFGQNAVVIGVAGEPPELVWCTQSVAEK